MATLTMRDLAAGRAPALEVAESAFGALAASGTVHLTENVQRTLALLRSQGHANTSQSRALACALCAACADRGVQHALSPSDAAQRWRMAEDTIEAWFSEPLDTLEATMSKISAA